LNIYVANYVGKQTSFAIFSKELQGRYTLDLWQTQDDHSTCFASALSIADTYDEKELMPR